MSLCFDFNSVSAFCLWMHFQKPMFSTEKGNSGLWLFSCRYYHYRRLQHTSTCSVWKYVVFGTYQYIIEYATLTWWLLLCYCSSKRVFLNAWCFASLEPSWHFLPKRRHSLNRPQTYLKNQDIRLANLPVWIMIKNTNCRPIQSIGQRQSLLLVSLTSVLHNGLRIMANVRLPTNQRNNWKKSKADSNVWWTHNHDVIMVFQSTPAVRKTTHPHIWLPPVMTRKWRPSQLQSDKATR